MRGEIFKENLSWSVFSAELDSGARVVEELWLGLAVQKFAMSLGGQEAQENGTGKWRTHWPVCEEWRPRGRRLGQWSRSWAICGAHSHPCLEHGAHRPPEKSYLLPFPFWSCAICHLRFFFSMMEREDSFPTMILFTLMEIWRSFNFLQLYHPSLWVSYVRITPDKTSVLPSICLSIHPSIHSLT